MAVRLVPLRDVWLGLLLRLLDDGQAAGPLDPPLRWLVVGTVVLTGGAAGPSRGGHSGRPPDPRWLVLLMLVLPLMGAFCSNSCSGNLREDARWTYAVLRDRAAPASSLSTSTSNGAHVRRLRRGRAEGAGPVHLLALPLLLVAARRRSDWMAPAVSRRIALHSATLVLAGLYPLAISSVGYHLRYFGGTGPRAGTHPGLRRRGAARGAAAASGALRAKPASSWGKHFFRYRFDYREEWLRFTTTSCPPQVAGRGRRAPVARPGRHGGVPAAGGLWQQPDANGPFVQTASWNLPPQTDAEPADSAFCTFPAARPG